jgi:molybdate transport system permease protein
MNLSPADFAALILSFKLAFVTTLILILLSTPLAWWLSRSQSVFRHLVSALVSMPLVLPPSVLGFYLLISLGPNGPIGKLNDHLGIASLAFSFWGLVFGSIIYSLPFVVQPIQNAMQAMGQRPLEQAATLGANKLDAFFSVVVPLAWPGFLTGAVLGFAHTLGEFGIVLMIGGNIPNETRVASVQIYDHVEALDYASAHGLSLILVLISFIVLFSLYVLQGKSGQRWFNFGGSK